MPSDVTLSQLGAFVLVARLGSVKAAAEALGVSEPAVSGALAALRLHLGDQLITRAPAGMTIGGATVTSKHRCIIGTNDMPSVTGAGPPDRRRRGR